MKGLLIKIKDLFSEPKLNIETISTDNKRVVIPPTRNAMLGVVYSLENIITHIEYFHNLDDINIKMKAFREAFQFYRLFQNARASELMLFTTDHLRASIFPDHEFFDLCSSATNACKPFITPISFDENPTTEEVEEFLETYYGSPVDVNRLVEIKEKIEISYKDQL